MKKWLLVTLFSVISLNTAAAQTVRFATEASYPPFEFISSDNKIQGFDIDLANALCNEMKIECTFTNQTFDSLIPSLKFRRTDAVMAGIDITPEREKQVLFTQAYYTNSAIFITRKDTVASVAALQDKRVGVQNGTTHQKYLADKYPDMTTAPYDSYQNAILDLKNGRIDAVFGDTAVVNEWLKQHANLATLGEKITDKSYFGTGLGIALRNGNHELQHQFNAALDKIKNNGIYQALYQKWFPQ